MHRDPGGGLFWCSEDVNIFIKVVAMFSTCHHNVWGHHFCGSMKREARTCSEPPIAPPPLLFLILLSALLPFSLISVVRLLIFVFNSSSIFHFPGPAGRYYSVNLCYVFVGVSKSCDHMCQTTIFRPTIMQLFNHAAPFPSLIFSLLIVLTSTSLPCQS